MLQLPPRPEDLHILVSTRGQSFPTHVADTPNLVYTDIFDALIPKNPRYGSFVGQTDRGHFLGQAFQIYISHRNV